MAKRSKKSKEAAASQPLSTAPAAETQTDQSPEQTEQRPAAKRAAKKPTKAGASPAAGAKSRGTVPRKSTKSPRSRRAGNPASAKVDGAGTISDKDIRLRAYFISERRHQEGRAGDSAHDWLEAIRQLQEEASTRA